MSWLWPLSKNIKLHNILLIFLVFSVFSDFIFNTIIYQVAIKVYIIDFKKISIVTMAYYNYCPSSFYIDEYDFILTLFCHLHDS